MRRFYLGRIWPHVMAGLFVLWVVTLVLFDTRDASYGYQAPPTTLQSTTLWVLREPLTDAEMRADNAEALAELRLERDPPPGPASEGEPDEVPPPPRELPPELATTTTTTTTIVPVTTITTITNECDRVPNPGPVWLTEATMSWCPMVASHLRAREWPAGALSHLLLIMECESNGIAGAVNSSSGTSGLFQHRPKYWIDRSTKAGHTGNIMDPHNNIGTGVWLFLTGGAGHWDGCEPQIESTLQAMRRELE